MSLNNYNSTASSRTSIFETFGVSNLTIDSAANVAAAPTSARTTSVIDSSSDATPVNFVTYSTPPASLVTCDVASTSYSFQDVESFEEGGATDDVECIEEAEDYATLFMSCSPGRASDDETESPPKVWQRNIGLHKKDKTKATNQKSYNEKDDSRSSRAKMEESRVGSSSKALCHRSNCPNVAVDDPRWRNDYCCPDCVVSHCREVFSSWIAMRRDNIPAGT